MYNGAMKPHTEFVVEFSGNKTDVLMWLVSQMVDDEWTLTTGNLSARNSTGQYRWAMAGKKGVNKVRFSKQEDAEIFALCWGTKWDWS